MHLEIENTFDGSLMYESETANFFKAHVVLHKHTEKSSSSSWWLTAELLLLLLLLSRISLRELISLIMQWHGRLFFFPASTVLQIILAVSFNQRITGAPGLTQVGGKSLL